MNMDFSTDAMNDWPDGGGPFRTDPDPSLRRQESDHRCPGVLCCPRCTSQRLQVQDSGAGRRWAAILGTTAGALSGAAPLLLELGLPFKGTSRLVWVGTGACLVIAMIAGAKVGCLAGAELGSCIDRHILRTEHCDDCGYQADPLVPV